MRKILILFALTFITLATLSGCAPKPVVTKVGTASVSAIRPTAVTAEAEGIIRVDVTTATVMLDTEGKFISVVFDVAQNDSNFNATGVVTNAVPELTKKEKGVDYGMKGNSTIGKEWFEQVEALETWLVGKTLAEAKALPLVEGRVADSEDLRSSVSIRVGTFMTVLEKAVDAAVELNDVAKIGAVTHTTIQPTDATATEVGRIRVNTTLATVALDSDGKLLHVFLDVAQNDSNFDATGVVTNAEPELSKKEKGADYGMKGNSTIGKEWFEQIAALETWMVGQTLAEVKALPVAEGRVAESEDLRSSVSVRVGDFLTAVEKAYNAAK